MRPAEIESVHALTPMQQGMLFHSLREPGSHQYIEQSVWTFKGPLDMQAFQGAWQFIVDRHDILRTAIVWEGVDEPVQVVCRRARVPFETSTLPASDLAQSTATDVRDFLQSDRVRGVDLGSAPLMRVTMLSGAPGTHHCVWTHHHIILDGWSVPLIMGELVQAYAALVQGVPPSLPAVRPYRDYLTWLGDRDPNAAQEFWTAALLGFGDVNDLRIAPPAARPLSAGGYSRHRSQLDPALSADIQRLCRAEQVTLGTLMQSCWGLLISRYSGDDDVIFGATVSGRPSDLAGSASMVGLFINTIPVRVRPPAGAMIRDWLRRHQEWMSAATQYEYASLADIQRWTGRRDDEGLFRTLLVVENFPTTGALQDPVPGVVIEPGPSFTRTNYPLTLAVTPGPSIGIEIGYDHALVGDGMPEAIARHLATILTQLTRDPGAKVSSLSLAGPKHLTLARSLPLSVDADSVQSPDIVADVRRRALEDPGHPALRDPETTVSYGALDLWSDRIAHVLMRRGVGPEVIVGIIPDRSVNTITILLGILKAGGAYLPLDVALPPERMRRLLEGAGATFLLTSSGFGGSDLLAAERVIGYDTLMSLAAQEGEPSLIPEHEPASAAYVVFTSGSTGVPKGVVVPRNALAHLAVEMRRTFDITSADRSLHFLSLSFDAAGEEIFPALVAGATLIIHPEPSRTGPQEFLRFIKEEQVTIAHLPTAFWHCVAEHLTGPDTVLPETLRELVVGGESPSVDALGRWARVSRLTSRFRNVYGPTETTVAATQWCVTAMESAAGIPDPLPIGRPLDGTTVYVLDQLMHPLPPGITGELYIGGAGVSRGYAQLPGPTAGVFLPDPFSAVPGARMYRTGDTGYADAHGSITFRGRRDRQCKVRGYRIEPGEIEDRLRAIEGIRNAVVLMREDPAGERRLVAYLEAPGMSAASMDPVAEELRRTLPEHLIPSRIVPLEKLPTTLTGKIDHRALLSMGNDDDVSAVGGDPPRGSTESIIAGIWQEILHVPSVCRHDGFFALGGHSLLAIRLLYRLRDAFSLDLSMADVFEARTLADLAGHVDARLRDPALGMLPPVLQVDRSGVIPLSYAQQRLWFLDQLQPGMSVYTIPSLFRLRGPLDFRSIVAALTLLIRRHEALRTTYHVVDGVPLQHILPAEAAIPDYVSVPWNGEVPTDESMRQKIAAEIRTPFHLDEGPLCKFRLFGMGEDDHLLLIAIHHSIADGWSIGILMRDLCEAYEAEVRGRRWEPRPLAYHYADFAVWQRQILTEERMQVLVEHWRSRLAGFPPLSTLPLDHPRPAEPSFTGAVERCSTDAALVRQVDVLARRENATAFMTLLAAFHCALYHYAGQRDLVVGTPVAGRTHAAFDDVVGFFVNSLPLRVQVDASRSFADLLRAVRDAAIAAYAHQDLPFDRLVEELHPVRDLSHAPVFQTVFALQDITVADLAPAELQVAGVDVPAPTSSVDLSVEVTETGGGYRLACTFNADLFEQATIGRFLGHYVTLLRELVRNPDVPLWAVSMMPAAERRLQLVTWNQTRVPFDGAQTVHGGFAAQVRKQPGAIAVAYRSPRQTNGTSPATLTYAELDDLSDRIACRLRRHGLRHGDLVGIFMERSTDLVASVLACLKAGAGFIPLDTGYPPERLRFMVGEAQPRMILMHGAATEGLFKGPLFVLDPVCDAGDADPVVMSLPPVPVHPGDIAYVIFTSGSTGRPKGTLLAHRGLVNLAAAQASSLGITPRDRILQFSSLSFDASVWEVVMALLNGASLWLTDRDTIADPTALAGLLRDEQITTVTLPPSILAGLPPVALPSLTTIIVAGERCPPELVEQWSSGRTFVNAYGPTETTVCASLHVCDGQDLMSVPIGRPLQNVQAYIVDRDLQAVPVGVPGELLVGGVGLAYGYVRRADVTAEKFIPHPFDGRGERLYRTGDRCRYRADGSIDFLGRIDQQVKIRGFRIEPGEIEASLCRAPGVRDAAVIPREDPGTGLRLVAYVVMEDGSLLDGVTLRDVVRKDLPEFMVPSVFIRLDAMPLTPSGKTDRAALRAASGEMELSAATYVPPVTETEKELSGMVRELLHCTRAGAADSFFDLGGHSLLATQLVSRINGRWGITMALRTVFEHPTIAGIAAAIDAARQGETSQAMTITVVPRERVTMARSHLTQDGIP